MHYYLLVLKRYFQLTGRSERKEFWIYHLVSYALIIMTLVIGGSVTAYLSESPSLTKTSAMPMLISYGIVAVYFLLTLIPSIAVSVRRLHDINKSGWWILINFIPLGSFVFYVMMALKGNEGINRFDKTVADNDQEELTTLKHEHAEEFISEEEKEEIREEATEELAEYDPSVMGKPGMLMIGYIEEITKKGLKEYIIGQTYKYFSSPHYTVYRIEKYNNGYIYEIHDGGNKLTHLKKIKENFESGENEIILKTAGNYVKVAKSGKKLDCMILQDSDLEHSDETAKVIENFDMAKMEEAVPLGAGTFLSGLMFLSFGIIALFFAVLFKYGLLDMKEEPEDIEEVKLNAMPHERFERLPSPTTYRYVEKMHLEGSEWKISMKNIEMENEMPMEVVPADEVSINETEQESTMNSEMPQEDEFSQDETTLPEEIPVDESGNPVNVFEDIDEDREINEDMVEQEAVQGVDPYSIESSPN